MQHDDDDGANQNEEITQTELDTHAASIVVGRNALVINETGKTVNMGPFPKELGSLKKVPIVDCVVAHDCPYSNETYYLAMYNALLVPQMEENLLPPFVVRRQGHILNDTPKIQVKSPTKDDHCLIFENGVGRIPLQLCDTISYFTTRKPTEQEYLEASAEDKVIDLNVDEPTFIPSMEQNGTDKNMGEGGGAKLSKLRKRLK